uniref:tRNA threonylcarbamoyladenosine biosynthesis protein TsaE n=1 Tax=Candidatus Fritschea bemisiae TaxID=206681 RepID=Q7X396_9BACT|nr:YjeE [Candidatus Fritschea bemisiae]
MALIKYPSFSPEATKEIGRMLAKKIGGNKKGVLCLVGDIGAGKTTFSKGFASELVGISENQICSPTFNYLNIYEGICTLYHFDCYRLKDGWDFLNRGFDEYFEGLCLIEWSEKIEAVLPEKRNVVTIEPIEKDKRVITYEGD